jgi:hypothetical protein
MELELHKGDLKFLDHISTLEAICTLLLSTLFKFVIAYPEDEAATKEKIEFRFKYAGDYFYYGFLKGNVLPIGFVNGTLAHGQTLEHDTMSMHDPRYITICWRFYWRFC